MKKITVPKEIRKQGRKMVYSRVIRLIFYLILAYIVADYIYDGLKTTNFGNLSATIFFIVLIPFWVSGVPLKLIDKDWYGEIIRIDLKNSKPEKIDTHEQPPVTLTALVKTEDGKLYERPIYDEGEYFYGERENVYKVGDKVVHIRWTHYLSPVRTKADERPIACFICGCKSAPGTKICRSCSSPLEVEFTEIQGVK